MTTESTLDLKFSDTATTTAGIWLDHAFHFTTSRSEREARNLAAGRSSGWERS